MGKFVKCGYDNWLEDKAKKTARTDEKMISDSECFGINRVVPRNRDDMWDKLFDGEKDHNKEVSIGKPEKIVALILMHIVYPGKKGEIDEYFDRAVNEFARKMKWPMEVGKYNLSADSNGKQNGLTSTPRRM